jgi:carboxylesterase 1
MKLLILTNLLWLLKTIEVKSLIDAGCDDTSDIILETKNGKIKGSCTKIKTNDQTETADVYSWLSIPFAEPPIKDQRFKPPKPSKSWSGVLDGKKFPNACLHFLNKNSSVTKDYESLGIKLSEDCLYLNIYAPEKAFKRSKKLPVLVFIHGNCIF